MPFQVNGGPRTRQRIHKPPPTLAIPDIQDDAAERKRILNVLAQRRYRQRKLQSRAEVQVLRQSSTEAPAERQQETSPRSSAVANGPFLVHPNAQRAPELQELPGLEPPSLDWLTCPSDGSTLSYLQHIGDNELLAISAAFPDLVSTPNTNQTPHTTPLSTNDDAHSDNTSFTASSSTTFPDSYFLTVSPLTLLRGLWRIATRLNSASSIASLASISPFNLGLGPESSELPLAWQPTATQLLVPHHPVLDLLPWPSVRDRLIEVMSLTREIAETGATGPQLVDFVYDMEDVTEGVRIWGSDPYNATNWEIGQVVFERWWFVFDRSTVEQSNYLRRQRGAEPLRALTM